MKLEDVLDPTPFEKFINEFEKNWKLEESKPNPTFGRRNIFYEKTIKGVHIYQNSKNTLIGRLYEDDCWLNDRRLYDDLQTMMPRYTKYWLRKNNLLSDFWLE
jgi:hypothetical protein